MGGKIGVLALQGAFAKHEEMLAKLGIPSLQVRYQHQLSLCSGLIIPGGESTTMTGQIKERELLKPLKEFAKTYPIFGTCAGLILMAREGILSVLDISVRRNAYGRQKDSFTTPLALSFAEKPIEALFIRAPRISAIHSPDVRVLAQIADEPVLIQQGKHLAAAFHPELTNDSSVHRYFVGLATCAPLRAIPIP